MAIEDEIKKVATDGLRLVFSASMDFLDQIEHGLTKFREWSKTSKYKDVKGTEYKYKSEFILEKKREDKNFNLQKQVLKNNTKQIKLLKKICKKYGIDIYVETCPKNIDDIIKKYQNNEILSIGEQDTINAFTDRNDEGEILNVYRDGGVMMFNARDIDLMEEAVKDAQKQSLTIAKRKIRAKERVDSLEKVKQKMKFLSKDKDAR